LLNRFEEQTEVLQRAMFALIKFELAVDVSRIIDIFKGLGDVIDD